MPRPPRSPLAPTPRPVVSLDWNHDWNLDGRTIVARRMLEPLLADWAAPGSLAGKHGIAALQSILPLSR